MELTPYSEFAQLRLQQFCAADVAESDSADWEWMGGLWYCDSIGFTFGRLRDMPAETGALEIDFSELPESAWSSILASLRLPLHAGMTCDDITRILGEPVAVETLAFVDDRKTYEFRVGSRHPYHVSCTVQDDAGLTFVSLIREDVFNKIEAACSSSDPYDETCG